MQLLWVEHCDFIGEMDQKQLKAAVVKLLLALLEGRIDTSVTRVVAQVQKVCSDRAWSFLVFSSLTHAPSTCLVCGRCVRTATCCRSG